MDVNEFKDRAEEHYQSASGHILLGERYLALLDLSIAMHYYLKIGYKDGVGDYKRDIIDLIRQAGLSENHFNVFDNHGREVVRNQVNKADYLRAIVDGFSLKPKSSTKKVTMVCDFSVYRGLETRDIGDKRQDN